MDSGTYSLVVEAAEPVEFEAGALGELDLKEGLYAYTGSARGSGGFGRVERHLRVLRGEHDVRKWHVDHLNVQPDIYPHAVVKSHAGECEVAEALAERFDGVEGFGCSDCRCGSHLHRVGSVAAVSSAHRRASTELSVKSYTSRRR